MELAYKLLTLVGVAVGAFAIAQLVLFMTAEPQRHEEGGTFDAVARAVKNHPVLLRWRLVSPTVQATAADIPQELYHTAAAAPSWAHTATKVADEAEGLRHLAQHGGALAVGDCEGMQRAAAEHPMAPAVGQPRLVLWSSSPDNYLVATTAEPHPLLEVAAPARDFWDSVAASGDPGIELVAWA